MKPRKKKTVSETERELVVRIPRVVGVRPIVAQPKTVVVAFEVEHVRVAIGVSLCDASSVPLSIQCAERKGPD